MKKKHSTGTYLFLLPIIILLINGLLISCKKDDTNASVGSNVRLLINNLSPDVYPVQLYINNVIQNPKSATANIITTASSYYSYSYNTPSAYFAVKTSPYPLQIRSTRTGDTVLFNVNDTLKSNTSYSLFVTGLRADNSISFNLLVDDTASLPTKGRGKIRYFNGTLRIPNNVGYDVYANGTLALSNITSLKLSKYIEVPAGTYDFKFVTAGSNIGTSSNVLVDLPGIVIQDGSFYTLYSRGITGRIDSAAVGASVIANTRVTTF